MQISCQAETKTGGYSDARTLAAENRNCRGSGEQKLPRCKIRGEISAWHDFRISILPRGVEVSVRLILHIAKFSRDEISAMPNFRQTIFQL